MRPGIMELALLRLWGKRLDESGQLQPSPGSGKAVYLAPIRWGAWGSQLVAASMRSGHCPQPLKKQKAS